jgi:hypothetical protein
MKNKTRLFNTTPLIKGSGGKAKCERQGRFTAYNNGMAVRGGVPPLSQIAKVICGRAFVSIHMRPVSTPSLRSVGHSPHVHGTQAQIYLATSPYLNVVQNTGGQGKKTKAWLAKYKAPVLVAQNVQWNIFLRNYINKRGVL